MRRPPWCGVTAQQQTTRTRTHARTHARMHARIGSLTLRWWSRKSWCRRATRAGGTQWSSRRPHEQVPHQLKHCRSTFAKHTRTCIGKDRQSVRQTQQTTPKPTPKRRTGRATRLPACTRFTPLILTLPVHLTTPPPPQQSMHVIHCVLTLGTHRAHAWTHYW